MAARSELIGLEATAKPKWLRELLACFTQLEAEGLVFDERVLHINGSGFVASLDLGLALQDFGLNQLKLSRCHDDEVVNQQIMCFNCNLCLSGTMLCTPTRCASCTST